MKLRHLILMILLYSQQVLAQSSFSLRLGISPPVTPQNAANLIRQENDIDNFTFQMTKNKTQFFGGLYYSHYINEPFFLEAGIQYTVKSCQYQMTYLVKSVYHPQDVMSMEEKEHILIMPLSIGVHLGPIAITSGWMAYTNLKVTSDMHQMKGYSGESTGIKLGWQAAARYEWKQASFGIDFIGQSLRVCKGMYMQGRSLELRNIPLQFVAWIQYSIS